MFPFSGHPTREEGGKNVLRNIWYLPTKLQGVNPQVCVLVRHRNN